jgi:hypothetical protein
VSLALRSELPAAPPAPDAPPAAGPLSGAAARAPPANGSSEFSALLEGLGREVHQGEALVRSAVSSAAAGRVLGPAELIALQAGIYRYGEAIDLASRIVDRGTSAVRTVLQAQ